VENFRKHWRVKISRKARNKEQETEEGKDRDRK
jgi:hypothetical protein